MKIHQMIKRSRLSLLGLLGLTLFASPAAAQVAAGPSDPSSFDTVIDLPVDVDFQQLINSLLLGIGGGATVQLNIPEGVDLGNGLFAFTGSEVNIVGGSVGNGFDALSGSVVNVVDGGVGNGFDANSGSVVNVSGGIIGDFFNASSGSEVNVSGGDFGQQFLARSGSVVNISGGIFGENFLADTGSVVNISGGFLRDMGNAAGNFNVSGGRVADGFDARSGSVVNISGGSFENGFNANSGSEVNISGGTVGSNDFFDRFEDGFDANGGSVVNISGGNLENGLIAKSGSEVNISGGALEDEFEAEPGSEVNISGGLIGRGFQADSGSTVNVSGSNFALDGVLLNNLTLDNTFTIVDRDVILTGLLVDGSAFSLELNSASVSSDQDSFSLSGLLTVTPVGSVFTENITHIPRFTFLGDSNDDFFGTAVSGAGDVNGDGFDDVIVGAREDDNGRETNAGAARVFSGADGSILYNFLGDSINDEFGTSVSGAGDVNGDGFADFIVGAPNDNPNGNDSGSARVFSGADGSVLYNFDGDSSDDSFGTSVSDAGDVNGDGFDDVIVGAFGDDDGGDRSGSAQVFSGADGSVLYRFDGESAGEAFGISVSGAGDVNGDGIPDLVVGASAADNNGVNTGAARVFSGADGSVLYKFLGEAEFDFFGFPVSGAGDVNGDGFADLIVGASNADAIGSDGFRTGLARVFSGADGSVLYNFDGDSTFDNFGASVGGAGDVNGDGFADLIVGASRDDNNNSDSGNVRVFSGADGSVLLDLNGDRQRDALGVSVSGAGDVNGDGVADFVVGGQVDFGRDNGFARVFTSLIPAGSSNILLGDVDQDGVVTFSDIAAFIAALQSGTFIPEADINQDGELNFSDVPLFIAILQAI